jgi:hypothetical protein
MTLTLCPTAYNTAGVLKLDQFPSAARSRYPWQQLLDGAPSDLIEGEDFTSKPMTVIANAREQAKRRGGSVRTRLLQNGDRASVVIQFKPRS